MTESRRLSPIVIGLILVFVGVLSGGGFFLFHEKDAIQGQGSHAIVDDWGRTVMVPNHPRRIISLTSAYEPILLEMVGPERLGAVSFLTKTKGYGPNWEEGKRVKVSLYSYGTEKILSLRPDLVLAPEYTSRDVLEGLTYMGIPVVIVRSPKTVDDTLDLITKLGHIVQEEENAYAMVESVKDDIREMQHIREQYDESQTIISMSSMDGYAGTNSLFDDMCRLMGLKNGASVMAYAPKTAFTEERIIEMNPHVILIPVYDKSEMAWETMYLHNPGLQTVRAVKENRVIPMNASNLYTGNQFIGKSMKDILELVYSSKKGE